MEPWHHDNLCVFDAQGAAAGVNVTAVQIHFRPLRRLDAVELHHCLDSILFEDYDSIHFAVWVTDLMDHLLSYKHTDDSVPLTSAMSTHAGNGIRRIDDRDQQDMVFPFLISTR